MFALARLLLPRRTGPGGRCGVRTGVHTARLAMRMRGLEPPRAFAHTDLNRARLPIPPHPRGWTVYPSQIGAPASCDYRLEPGKESPPVTNCHAGPLRRAHVISVSQAVTCSAAATSLPRTLPRSARPTRREPPVAQAARGEPLRCGLGRLPERLALFARVQARGRSPRRDGDG
jgi:hypothetical protein